MIILSCTCHISNCMSVNMDVSCSFAEVEVELSFS